MTVSLNLASRVSLAVALAAVAASGCASPTGTTEGSKSTSWFNGGFLSSLTGSGSAAKKPAANAQAKNAPAARPKTKLNEDDAMTLAGLMAKGNEMEKQGNLVKARQAYETLIAQFPDEPGPRHRLGVVADREKRHREAQILFQESLDRDPNNAEVHADLGYCFYLQGKLADAEAQTLHAVQLSRRNGRYRNNLGLIYGQQGKYRESLEEFRMAGSEADAMYNLAFIYASQNKVEVAKQCFERALVADPQHEASKQALESFANYENLPEGMRDLDYAEERGSRPYVEGGEVVAVAAGSHGEAGEGRVAPASASHTVRSRDASAHRREIYNNVQKEMSYPRTGEQGIDGN